MIPPATTALQLARAETTELRPVLPANLPVKLRVLMDVHLTVTSRRWQIRRASRDGTVHHQADGAPVMRVRTEQLTPVPSAERTAR